MKKLLYLTVLLTSFSWVNTAFAQLAGHNIIFVHGFKSADLNTPRNLSELTGQQLQEQALKNNAEVAKSNPLFTRMDLPVIYDSSDRIEGGIAITLYKQIKEIAQQKRCENYCIVVASSAGDLVTRYILANQARWLEADGLPPLKILMTVDFFGAGGGTEAADLAIAGSSNLYPLISWLPYVNDAFKSLIGFVPTPGHTGIVADLQTNKARSLAVSTPSAIPRFRFVSEFTGPVSYFVKGSDDNLVPAHSACGGMYAEAVDSCSSQVAMNGHITKKNSPSKFYFNNFPVLMSDNVRHGAALNADTSGNHSALVIENNQLLGEAAFTAEKAVKTNLWVFKQNYIYAANPKNLILGELIFSTLDKYQGG